MTLPREIQEALNAASESGRFRSLQDVQDFTADLMAGYNSRPQPDLHGLSPEQVHRLIYFPWGSAESAVRLNAALALDDFRGAPLLNNARIFIEQVVAAPIKATVAGNLNRKFVVGALAEMSWDEDDLDFIRSANKVFNEEDLWALHVLRVLLQLTGVIRKRQGYFRATKKAVGLMAPENAGELFALLFSTCFTKMNLAYLDWAPENQALQQTIAVPLHLLHKLDDSWRSPKTLKGMIWLPVVAMESTGSEWTDSLLSLTINRLFRPLIWFGLIEKQVNGKTFRFGGDDLIRRKPLYRRFLKFDL